MKIEIQDFFSEKLSLGSAENPKSSFNNCVVGDFIDCFSRYSAYERSV